MAEDRWGKIGLRSFKDEDKGVENVAGGKIANRRQAISKQDTKIVRHGDFRTARTLDRAWPLILWSPHDYQKEVTMFRRAVVYELMVRKLFCPRRPPVGTLLSERGVVLTYLVPGDSASVRVGIFCKLSNIISYHATSSDNVRAVILEPKSGAELQNLRMHLE